MPEKNKDYKLIKPSIPALFTIQAAQQQSNSSLLATTTH